MAQKAVNKHPVSIRLACECFALSESAYRYQPKFKSENEQIAQWLIRLTEQYRRWGFKLCFYYLRNVKGFGWNHKRVYRIYCELALNLRIKPKRRLKRDRPQTLPKPTCINQVWSMDFMSDRLSNGQALRSFNVLDDYNREGLAVELDLSMPARRVIQALDRVIEWRGKPKMIRCDNGPEYLSQALVDWANAHQINLIYIQPGKPTQNAYIERFNRTVRQEWLDAYAFDSLVQIQHVATAWLWHYNNERPHLALGGIPPRMMLNAA